MKYGYARISTLQQDLEAQIHTRKRKLRSYLFGEVLWKQN